MGENDMHPDKAQEPGSPGTPGTENPLRANLTPADEAELVTRFTYHPPADDVTRMKYEHLRLSGARLARDILELVPQCAERTLAIRDIERAIMQANAAIARAPARKGHTDRPSF